MNIVHKSVEYKSQFLEVGDIAPFLQDLVNLVPRIHPRFRHVDLDLELVVDGGDDDLDFVVDVRVAPPVEQSAPVKKIAVSDRVLHLHMTTFFFYFHHFCGGLPKGTPKLFSQCFTNGKCVISITCGAPSPGPGTRSSSGW